MATRMIRLAVCRASSSWNSMCVAPGNLALALVETTFVWKHFCKSVSAGNTHCTSTSITSTAPVMIASSCWRKLPAMGMPCRMRISLAVQQMPARLIPLAPRAFGLGHKLRVAGGGHDHVGERRLVAVNHDVHLVLLRARRGSPASAADAARRRGRRRRRWRSSSRPSRRPAPPGPQPRRMCSASLSTPMVVMCMPVTTSRSMPRGVTLERRPVLLLLLRGAADVRQVALLAGRIRPRATGPGPWRSASSLRPSQGMPYSSASARSLAGPRILYASDFPSAAKSRAWTISRPWSECAAVPAADVPEQVAGHDHVGRGAADAPPGRPSPNGSMRHGPMKQFRQQIPSRPKPHCGSWASSRSQAVRMSGLAGQLDHLLRGRVDRTLLYFCHECSSFVGYASA